MATKVPAQLNEVADLVLDGKERQETVRTLLSWFGAARRSYRNVRQIRRALNKTKLKTDPDFEESWIDASVKFLPKLKVMKNHPLLEAEAVVITRSPSSQVPGTENEVFVPKRSVEDMASRIKIGMLSAANMPPLCVSPDAKLSEAITLMLQHDYSQLPVATTERDLKGILTWKSLGSCLALGKKCERVSECMEPANEIRLDASLFEAIQQIVEHECVLVRDASRKLTGVVTTADLSVQFARLGEPFLLLGQIENHIRNLIADKYTPAELATVRDPADADRDIEDVSDLTLGEYIRLLENPKRWDKLSLKIDRKMFVEELKRIGRIRNDVMHFDPDGPSPEDLATLRKFSRFLSDLEKKLL
jgi:CBS domain-containing protein